MGGGTEEPRKEEWGVRLWWIYRWIAVKVPGYMDPVLFGGWFMLRNIIKGICISMKPNPRNRLISFSFLDNTSCFAFGTF